MINCNPISILKLKPEVYQLSEQQTVERDHFTKTGQSLSPGRDWMAPHAGLANSPPVLPDNTATQKEWEN